MSINLSIDEIYAIQGMISGLTGLTKGICKDFGVDNMELFDKLESYAEEYLAKKYPV